MSPDLHDNTWMRCGISLLVGCRGVESHLLRRVRPQPARVLASASSRMAGRRLKLINNRTLVIAGLEAAMDTLSPQEAVEWLERKVYPAVRDFQDNVADGGGEAALIFWFADANGFHHAADNTTIGTVPGAPPAIDSIGPLHLEWGGVQRAKNRHVELRIRSNVGRAISSKNFVRSEQTSERARPTISNGGNLASFKPGERVRHADLGEGVVIAARGRLHQGLFPQRRAAVQSRD